MCPVAPGCPLKACCQINFQPLNLNALLMMRFGLSCLLTVKLHLQLTQHQKTTLLPFVCPQGLLGEHNEMKHWCNLNSGVHKGVANEDQLNFAGLLKDWPKIIHKAHDIHLVRPV